MMTTTGKPTGTEPKASRVRIENERQVSEMATTKTAKPTKTTRPAATKRAASTNGSKPTAAAKETGATKMATRRKKPEEMTLDELGQLAWATSYKNRHKRLDS